MGDSLDRDDILSGLTDRAIGMVERILDGGLPTVVPSTGPIDL